MALDGIDLELRTGEVLALLGENGAGKSTLVHVLGGLVRPDAGSLELAGRDVDLRHWSPARAIDAGVGIVHQHSTLVPAMSIPENLAIGRLRRGWRYHAAAERARVAELAERFDLALPLDAPVRELSVGQRQRAEIARALERGARVLVLDEPTAALTPGETLALFPALRRLRDAGCGVVFISHKLGEIEDLADRVAVLRRGRVVAVLDTAAASAAELGRLMLGAEAEPRDVPVPRDAAPPQPRAPNTPPRLALVGVSASGTREASRLRGVDLRVAAGEIVGIAGIDGNGQRELEEVLAGVRPLESGHVEIAGCRVEPTSRALRAHGVAHLSGERERGGLVPGFDVAENLALKGSFDDRRFFRMGFVDRRAMRDAAREAIARFGIEPADPDADIATLSGGNAQKVTLARELSRETRVLVAMNPTRGLDVAATARVHAELRRLRASGAGVLLVSTELDEVLVLCDRVFALVEGQLVPLRRDADRGEIGAVLLGRAAGGAA